MSKPPTVFLSYVHKDISSVEQIYNRLFAEGFEPWIDRRNIMPGSDWSSEIGKAIRQSDFMLVFISRNSVSKRGYIQSEIRAALNILSERPVGEIFLIPVRLDDSSLPQRLSHIQYVDLFEKEGWPKLLKALRLGLERGKFPSEGIHSLKQEFQREVRKQKTDKKPHIFVAMPFGVEMEDLYYYGILRAVEANDFTCERIDQRAFTGNILQQIKSSIQAAVAVIAELTGANANVHLELGYAWGTNVPTILLLRDGHDLCFDVRGQRCLKYNTIKSLEVVLTEELVRLKGDGSISGFSSCGLSQ